MMITKKINKLFNEAFNGSVLEDNLKEAIGRKAPWFVFEAIRIITQKGFMVNNADDITFMVEDDTKGSLELDVMVNGSKIFNIMESGKGKAYDLYLESKAESKLNKFQSRVERIDSKIQVEFLDKNGNKL